MPPEPYCALYIEFEIAVFDGPVISFTNKTDTHDAEDLAAVASWEVRGFRGSNQSESNRIPNPLPGRPATTVRVAEIAELLENILRRKLTFVSWGGAMAAPSTPQGKPRRMRPCPVFQLHQRHEVRASQLLSLQVGIIGTDDCSQSKEV